jgi:hypothetical protein
MPHSQRIPWYIQETVPVRFNHRPANQCNTFTWDCIYPSRSCSVDNQLANHSCQREMWRIGHSGPFTYQLFETAWFPACSASRKYFAAMYFCRGFMISRRIPTGTSFRSFAHLIFPPSKPIKIALSDFIHGVCIPQVRGSLVILSRGSWVLGYSPSMPKAVCQLV